MRIAYVNYGEQSGVTPQVSSALASLGHEVTSVFGRGPLELREKSTRRPRLTGPVLTSLALAAARFGRQALAYRWNTGYAFDVHSRWAGLQLARLPHPPDVVLQNGALFAPGMPPEHAYVVYLDHTRALTERAPGLPWAGYEKAPSWGPDWLAREGATYRGAAAVATFSRNAADSVVRDYGVDPHRVHVVGAGANVFPAQWSRQDDGRTIVFVGREFERKGGVVLAEAFALLRRERPQVRLLVAGPPQPIPLPDGAVHLGPVAYAELPALFARATVFALPALHEPFGIAFLDAMACALPCVGTRTNAVPEIVDDGETGLLVPRGDVRALHAALRQVIDDRDRARRMGERGRAKVQERFTWTSVAHRLERVLFQAAGHGVPAESCRRAVQA
jgi:glycosyltransferase involved in cell wall biosynthesis